MWRKLLGILTLFSFLPYFSICQNKLRENGWYHILSGQTDSISKEPIVTTKDFIALKLDTDYFGKYVISGQISNYKRKKWAEETGKATGRQIAFIFNDSVITNPRVNCSIESGAFQITSVLDEKLPDIYKQLKQEKIDSIETLFKRGYMERCKKSLVPTEKGLALNSVVKTMRIADVAMTGEWEKELARIERGELSDDTFRKEIEAYTREITSELISCDKLFGSRDSGCACPKCGTGRMRFYGKVVRCDNTECGLPVFRLKAGRTLSDDEIKDLLTEGHTKLLKGFKSKQGKSFDAVVAFDGEYNTTFVFPEAKKDKKFSGRKK